MKYTLTESQAKKVNIGDTLYFIYKGDDVNDSCVEISKRKIVGKIIKSDDCIKYFIRFIPIGFFKEEKTYEIDSRDLCNSYFKTEIDAINSIRHEMQKIQSMINRKFDKLNEMVLGINPLTYTTKSEATNSPSPKFGKIN